MHIGNPTWLLYPFIGSGAVQSLLMVPGAQRTRFGVYECPSCSLDPPFWIEGTVVGPRIQVQESTSYKALKL